ncbi:hypothetical protein CBL_21266 [Carabus blaptoides fortunei]
MLRTDDSVETVCSKFIERFWSRDQQIDARLKLETDRLEHVAVFDPDVPGVCPDVLLSIIARHYPPNIQIGLRGVRDVPDFEARLKIFDRSRGVYKKNVEVSSSTKAHRTSPEAQRFERPHLKFSTQKPRERVAVLGEEETEDAGIVAGNGNPRAD